MQFKSFPYGAAVLLALSPSAFAAGVATIINNCGIPVYYSSVAAGGVTNMQLLPAGGWSTSMAGSSNGVSVKLAPSPTGAHTQLEFTMTGNKLAYDMSNIDGNPFASGGMLLTPSKQGDAANPSCIPVNCPAGPAVCSAAYNLPDDVRTLVCDASTDLTLTLCPSGHMKREESSAHVHRVHARHLPKRA